MSRLRAVVPFLFAAFVTNGCTDGLVAPRATEPLAGDTAAPTGALASAPVSPTPTSSSPAETTVGSTLRICSRPAEVGLRKLELAVVADWDGDEEVYVIRGDGSNLTQLTNNTTGDVGPTWSPDGQHIAFVADAYTNPRLLVAQADGSAGRVLRPDFEISSLEVEWSPDSDLLAFRNGDDLYVMNATTGELTLLIAAATGIVPGHPMFSPNGSTVAFAADVRGATPTDRLFSVNRDGTGLTELGFIEGHGILRTAWRPHTDQILFETSSPAEGTALYLASIEGTITKVPLDTGPLPPKPAWSADGAMLGYILNEFGFDSTGKEISRDSLHIATPDGEIDVAVIEPPENPNTPLAVRELVWAPDGRHIAYSVTARGGEGVDLYVLDVCDGTSLLVAQTIDEYSTPSWRPLP